MSGMKSNRGTSMAISCNGFRPAEARGGGLPGSCGREKQIEHESETGPELTGEGMRVSESRTVTRRRKTTATGQWSAAGFSINTRRSFDVVTERLGTDIR